MTGLIAEIIENKTINPPDSKKLNLIFIKSRFLSEDLDR